MTSSRRLPPYPLSQLITRWTWDPLEGITRSGLGPVVVEDPGRRDGSDNWPLTWADDGALYVTYGDGYGFRPYLKEKLGLGFGRVTGEARSFLTENIRSETGENSAFGREGRKGSGLLMVDGVLYLWLFHADGQGGQSQLAVSCDHAASWSFCDWRFAEFGLCTFINFGANYAGARDHCVYVVSHDGPQADTPADQMILMRVLKYQIAQRAAYQFFAGLDGSGTPTWSSEVADRKPVFGHHDACLRSGISYCAPLERYLWWQQLPQPAGHPDRGDTRFDGGFGIYEAPEPWGPWSTAFFTEEWDVGPGERAEFPTKWMSADGLELRLVFSGDDGFCVRRAVLGVERAAGATGDGSREAPPPA
jgi:hypothetical protein